MICNILQRERQIDCRVIYKDMSFNLLYLFDCNVKPYY